MAAEASARPGETAPPAAPNQAADGTSPTAMSPIAAIAILIGLFLALPFLGGLENLMGLIIIAIGLYEAWKFNRRAHVTSAARTRLRRRADYRPHDGRRSCRSRRRCGATCGTDLAPDSSSARRATGWFTRRS